MKKEICLIIVKIEEINERLAEESIDADDVINILHYNDQSGFGGFVEVWYRKTVSSE